MRFRDDDRAVTVQIGAVLLFATIVIALSLYQATVVPSQNADVEYKHSQTVQNQLSDVRNALLRTAGSGNSQPVSVTLGTQYPSRVFLMNPPPATGTLRTSTYQDGTVLVSNVDATNSETRDFLDGSWNASTKYLAYEPDYNEYDNPPTLLYESSVLSNYYPDADNGTVIPLTDQLLVDNETKTITLVTLNGSVSTTRSSSVSVSPEALSAPYQRVQVRPADATRPVNVSVPTLMSADVLAERTDLGSHPGVIAVRNDTSRPNAVNITVDWNETFTLQTARVGVGSGTEDPAPHYLTVVENRGDRVTVEARDRFNNPESGVTVRVNGSDPFVTSSKVTGEDGQATFEVRDGAAATTTLEIEDGSEDYERVTVSVDATAGGGGGGAAGRLVHVGSAFAFDGNDPDSVPGGLNLTVENTYGTDVTITDVTVEPEGVELDGLSDKATGEGYGQSELNVEDVSTGTSTAVDVPLASTEYTTVSARGLTLSLSQSRGERIYNTNTQSSSTAQTNVVGSPVGVASGGRAELAFAEFYQVSTSSAAAVNVSEEDFRVSVTYTQNGSSKTDQFVVYAQPPSGGGGGGGGGSSAGQISTVDGSTPSGESTAIVFDIENTGSTDATITDFSVSTPARQNPGADDLDTLNNGNSPEVEITGGGTDGEANAPGNGNDFDTDGTVYSLDTDAVIGSGNTATVDLREANGGSLQLTYELTGDASNADIVVALTFADGSTKEVYLRVTNVNS